MMTRSEEINELAQALAIAQGQIENASKDSANPFFKSKYADLASVWDAVRGPLSANGLAILQLPAAEGPKVTITTMLTHKSGQYITSDLTVTAREDTPQAVGSAITYARRYALQSTAGVAPEDDDGEGAQGRGPQRNMTGKPPVHTPAQQAVVDRKLAEAPKTEPSATTLKQRMEWFAAMKKDIGSPTYYTILGAHGFEHANEIKTLEQARVIRQEMEAAFDEQRSRGVA